MAARWHRPYRPTRSNSLFAKTRHLLRKALTRTVEAALGRLAKIFETAAPVECCNYPTNSSYAAAKCDML
jgi:hypothetical protein